jgi:hypothetical protein
MISQKIIRKRTAPTSNDRLIYRGTFIGNLIQLDHADILRYYNAVIRGIYNYYKFVNNMNQLAHIIWLIEESCCMTLMRKFKMKSMKRAYQKFGKDLGCNIPIKDGETKRIKLEKPASYASQPIKDIGIINYPFVKLEETWNNKFTKSNLFKVCIICGTDQNVEMHHVRKIRDLRNPETLSKDFLTRQMMAINRKQVPICQDHHKRYHNNTLTDVEIRAFRRATKSKLEIMMTSDARNLDSAPILKDAPTTSRQEKFKEYLNSTISEFDIIPKISKMD